jgi:protein transport protein SEC20
MMLFQSLNERLTALVDTTSEIQELITRLATLKFQPGSVPLEGDEGDVSQELSTEIGQTLREQDDELEDLTQQVKDFYPGRPDSERARQRERLDEMVSRAQQGIKKYSRPHLLCHRWYF